MEKSYEVVSTAIDSPASARPLAYQILRDGRAREADVTVPCNVFALLTRRVRERRHSADLRCAGRKRRSRDEELITLGRCRTTGHALPGKGIAVGVRRRETVGKSFQEG